MKVRFKQLRKLIAMVLIVTMIFLIPSEVFAYSSNAGEGAPNTINLSDNQEDNDKPEPQIVSEETKYRTEFTKTFKLDNGNMLAVQYDSPVHYKNDNGKWTDFNNQLTETAVTDVDDTETVIATLPPEEATETSETVEETATTEENQSEGIFAEDESEQTSTENSTLEETTDEPVTEIPTEAEPAAITEPIVATPQQETTPPADTKEYKNKNSNQDIRLAKKAKAQNMVKIKKDDYQISWGYIGAARSKATIVKNNEKLEGNDKFLINQKAVSETLYKEVYENVDLNYFVTSQGVKENIILKDSIVQTSFKIQYKAQGLSPVQKDNSTIELKDSTGKVIYSIAAPYMIDQKNEISTQLTLTIGEKKKNKFTIVLAADEDWIKDSSREFPIIVDPSLYLANGTANLTVGAISSSTPTVAVTLLNTSSSPPLSVDSSNIIVAKVNTLPSLPSGSVITKMTYSMGRIAGGGLVAARGYTNKTVDFSDTSTATTWDNRPTGNVVDYTTVQSLTVLDITKIAYQWYYENKNYGFAIERIGSTSAGTAYFYPFVSTSSEYTPYISIEFNCVTGTDGNQDLTQSVGRAGQGSVSGYTGKLTVTADDIGFDGNVMPVNISRVFDTSYTTNVGFFAGWRTNYHQRIYAEAVGTKQYYYFIDENGATHAFYDSNVSAAEDETIKDEDEFYELEVNGARTIATFKIKEGNIQKSFNSSGFLTEIKDTSQPATSTISISYFYANQGLINQITDGAGRTYKFVYGYNGSNYFVTSIQYQGTGTTALRTVSYAYTSNKLTSVTYPDSASIAYTYSGSNITKIQNIDSYNVQYIYTSNKVTKISEFANTTAGDYINIVYAKGMSTFTDSQNREAVLNYDPYGNQISTIDYTGRVTYSTSGANNSLVGYSSTLLPAVNRFVNPSFENPSTTGFSGTQTSGTTTVNYGDTTDKHTGNKALSLASAATSKYQVRQVYSYESGVTAQAYTLSAWIKSSGSTAKASLKITNTSGSNTVTATSATNGVYGEWTQISAKITPVGGQVGNITCDLLYDGTGEVYFDDVQLNPTDSLMDMTYVSGGDCVYGSAGWTYQNGEIYYLYGEIDDEAYAKQRVYIGGKAGDTYTVSGSGAAPAVPTDDKSDWTTNKPFFGLRVIAPSGTDTLAEVELSGTYASESFEDASDIFDFRSESFTLTEDCTYVDIYFRYDYNVDTAYIGNVALAKNTVYDYSFGNNGVQSNQATSSTEEPETATEEGTEPPTEPAQEDPTDAYGRLLSTTDDNGITTSYTYDSYGNTLSSTMSDGTTSILTSRDTYPTNGNYHSKFTDELDNEYTETVDSNFGTVTTYQYPYSNYFNYTYDSLNRLTSFTTDQSGINGTSTKITTAYAYTNDNLTSITHNGFNYNFAYNTWGDITSAAVGTQTLASYTYNDNVNRQLSNITYGNSQAIDYTYTTNTNNEKLLTKIKFTGDSSSGRFNYSYTSDGTLKQVVDNSNNRRTVYQSDGIKKIFDMSSNTIFYTAANTSENGNSVTYQTSFGATQKFIDSYDDEAQSTIRNYDYATGKTATVKSETDNFGRTNKNSVYTTDAANVVKTEYFYKSPSAGKSSNTVEKEKITTGTATPVEYTYVYDNKGNIVQIKLGATVKQEYIYDHLNQLIKNDDAVNNKTIKYAYNNGGNITSVKEYAYKTTTLNSTINYAYTDTNWKDKLTSYDSKAITYDNIGNPLTYDGWTYTWEGGRQLKQMVKSDGSTIQYKYDQDGLRTTKTIDGTSTRYVYDSGQLVSMKTANGTPLYFRYDTTGKPVSVKYENNEYFYVTNIFGDITGIVDKLGVSKVAYTYDAWGAPLTTTGTLASTLGAANPLRYRGYVFDSETGLYYLQSRYYNPQWKRFVNADSNTNTGVGATSSNVFAYCINNPLILVDKNGEIAQFIIAGVVFSNCVINTTLSIANNYFNQSVTINGFIYDQNKYPARAMRMGLGYGDYNGCGWIATYNAMKSLGKTVKAADVIRFFDVNGLIVQGMFGVTPWSIAWYFRLKGFWVDEYLQNGNDIVGQIAMTHRVAIVMILHDGWQGGHYFSLVFSKSEQYFYTFNYDWHNTTRAGKERSIKQLLDKDKKRTIYVIAIR